MSQDINPENIEKLLGDDPELRENISPKDVRKVVHEEVLHIEQAIKYLYDLTYLEGKIHCDNFHTSKKEFAQEGQKYGYINAMVRRDTETTQFRFSYRRPLEGTENQIIRKSIRPTATGYTAAAFKNAAHSDEKQLAILTEGHFSRLRKQGKVLKEVARKVRALDVYEKEE